jgi:hypothetical protein
MDSSGGGTTAVLADLATRVAAHALPRDAAIEIARATLQGTVDDYNLEAMFPDPGPKPKPVVVAPPSGDDDDDKGDQVDGFREGETPDPAQKPKNEAMSWRREAYEFEVGKPIEADDRLASLVVEWLDEYKRETQKLWKSMASKRSAASADPAEFAPGESFGDIPPAWESAILAEEAWALVLASLAGPRFEQLVIGALQATHDSIGGPFISATDPRVVKLLSEQRLVFDGITETLTEEIRDILAAAFVDMPDMPIEALIAEKLPELTARLERVFGTKEARAMAISRTETGRAQNTAQLMQMRESGVTRIAWVHDGNPAGRPNHIALSGSEVKLGEKFANGLLHPHDPNAPASEVVNCACTIRAVSFEED